jgi:hypothetical protein
VSRLRNTRNQAVLVLVLEGVDWSGWLRCSLEKFHVDSPVFSLFARLIFEDEHEDENSRRDRKIQESP